jgi:cardiolipin synthase
VLAAGIAGNFNWLCSGREVFPEMLAAIEGAKRSVCLETYIYSANGLGVQFREALLQACLRGVQVRVLYDALGSLGLPSGFWLPVREAGGEVRQFNPLSLHRLGIRDHRKLLVCDDYIAFVGGFNIASEYDGDGVTSGWYDIGLKIEGPLARELALAFDEMFLRAAFRQKYLTPWHKTSTKSIVPAANEQLLLSGPGRWRNPIKRALRQDLARAGCVRIMVAYFLPTWRIRRDLMRIVRQGGRVELLLAGKSDVLVSQLAGQSLYRRLLKAGVQVFEYQPQILHAKLIIIDDVVYVGSANLDQRSLNINHELMVRLQNPDLARKAREAFSANLKHCRQITLEAWSRSRTIWRRIKQRWAYFLLVRIDPYIAQWQWRALPDPERSVQLTPIQTGRPNQPLGK